MSERWSGGDGGGQRWLRLRTDDGPILELVVSQSDAAIDARLAVYDPPAAGLPSLADLSSCVLRERRGVVDRVARAVLKANPSDEDLWSAMDTVFARHRNRWAKAVAAAQSAADAAAASAPGVDRAALLAQITRAAFGQLTDG